MPFFPHLLSKASQFVIFFVFIFSFEISPLVQNRCKNILFSKLLWQISSIFVLFNFFFLCFFLLCIFFVLIFCFSFIVCFCLFYLVLFLRSFNEKHFSIIHYFPTTIFEWLSWFNSYKLHILLWNTETNYYGAYSSIKDLVFLKFLLSGEILLPCSWLYFYHFLFCSVTRGTLKLNRIFNTRIGHEKRWS